MGEKKFNLHFHKPAGPLPCASPSAPPPSRKQSAATVGKGEWEEPEGHSCKLTLLPLTAQAGGDRRTLCILIQASSSASDSVSCFCWPRRTEIPETKTCCNSRKYKAGIANTNMTTLFF